MSLGKYLGDRMGSWFMYILLSRAKVMLLWLFFITNTHKNQNYECSFATHKWLFTSYRLEICQTIFLLVQPANNE